MEQIIPQRLSWTPKEEKQLVELYKEVKWSYEKLAEHFETTVPSIASKLARLLAAENAPRDNEPFTAEEIAFLLHWIEIEAVDKSKAPKPGDVAKQWQRTPQKISQLKYNLKNPEDKISKYAVTKYAKEIQAYKEGKTRVIDDPIGSCHTPTTEEWAAWTKVNNYIANNLIINKLG